MIGAPASLDPHRMTRKLFTDWTGSFSELQHPAGLHAEDWIIDDRGQTYPDKAQQGCTRQSLFPILGAQSLKAVLMSGTDRQFWGTRDERYNHQCVWTRLDMKELQTPDWPRRPVCWPAQEEELLPELHCWSFSLDDGKMKSVQTMIQILKSQTLV